MLYSKSRTKNLDYDLFVNPSSEYRAAPFWGWNCELNEQMLHRQIKFLKKMGFGGFHMHPRSGISIKYLGEEFMLLIESCVKKAKDEGMFAWLYDEDRWPSGFAGGYVTKDKALRQKIVVFSEDKPEFVSKEEGIKTGKPYLLAIFDIIINDDGKMLSYKMIDENDIVNGVKKYVYVTTPQESGIFNNQTYVDVLSAEAIEKFIKTTHEKYKAVVGNEFGGTIPAIFTDEPQMALKQLPAYASGHSDISFPWTTDLDKIYTKRYNGENLIEKLPELVWDRSDGVYSCVKYRYYDITCELFAQNYAGKLAKWCNENNIALTGHVLCEQSTIEQSVWVGEAMRIYKNFTIPGIDMLCDNIELTTVKQAQSIVHQYEKEALMSELYGVTNWDFDFRGHKFQGDWQAALGVTLRVPHHALLSLKGCAKRDYPASINYQSPWYEDYSYVENHFARLNTVLTRGKPIVKVGVIHPVESIWLSYGPKDTTSELVCEIEENFQNVTRWLLSGMVDFDFISESLLPTQYEETASNIKVGKMEYSTIIVPECLTIRSTTLDIINRFLEKGGRVIFIGKCPKYVDGKMSDMAKKLYDLCEHTSLRKLDLLYLLNNERTAHIKNESGETLYKFVHTIRQDGDKKWLFIAHLEKDNRIDNIYEDNITIILNGEYNPTLYDTVNAKHTEMDFEIKNGKTYIYKKVFPHDSLLIELKHGASEKNTSKEVQSTYKVVNFKENVLYEREEDNVCVLDMASYCIDNGEEYPLEELTIIDDKCRKELNYPLADGCDTQPWVIENEKIEHYVKLKFSINSEDMINNVYIAAEEALSIVFNERECELFPQGYYVDENIKKYYLGTIKKGINTIEIKAPIGKRISLENFFLLGNFDVIVRGCEKKLIAPSKKIGFSDLTRQGLPFYGGNIIYKTEISVKKCSLSVRVNRYRGAAVKVYLDGEEKGIIAYSPYIINIENVPEGKHEIAFKLLGNRVNTFSWLHNCDYNNWFGPQKWYTYGENSDTENKYSAMHSTKWSYEYVLKEYGIISSPVIYISEHEKY